MEWVAPVRAVVEREVAAGSGTVQVVMAVDAVSVMTALLIEITVGFAGKAVEFVGMTAGPAGREAELAGMMAGTEDVADGGGKVAGRVAMVVECGRESAEAAGSVAEHGREAAGEGVTTVESGRVGGGAVGMAAGFGWVAAEPESLALVGLGTGKVAESERLVDGYG